MYKEKQISAIIEEALTTNTIPTTMRKIALVKAQKITKKTAVKTVMKDGFEETVNNQGNIGDYIVTNPSGEQYIVPQATFKETYVKFDDNNNFIKNKIVYMLPINEDIAIMAPWGEFQYIKAGGWLVVNSKSDAYGIQKEACEETYQIVNLMTREEIMKNFMKLIK